MPFPGSQAKEMNSNPVNVATTPLAESITDDQGTSAPPKKIMDINQPQTCKNKGCGQTFKEKDNHETACNYHPGPAVFHDRVRGVSYCIVNSVIYIVCVCVCIHVYNSNNTLFQYCSGSAVTFM